MRLGLFVPQGWRMDLVGVPPERHWETMLAVARIAEEGPYESVWVYDHFHTVPEPSEEATHEAWTLMAALAAATSRVRLGQMCTCMSYRNPMYLAKVAATIDVISGGRVEMGIGAGWYEHEWRAYGYGFPTAGERLAMLDEGVQIMRMAWEKGIASFEGTHYTVDGAICRPLPLQPRGIPLWVAGGGEKKTLRIAAEHASYTNFDGSLEGFTHKSEVLKGHCERLGRPFEEITRSANYNVVIGRNDEEVEGKLAAVRARYAGVIGEEAADQQVEALRGGELVGTPEHILERLKVLQDAGMTYAITYFPDLPADRSGVDMFTQEVAARLA